MQTVGIKGLKNKLSEYIRLAESGETVQVTDRGRVVAELVPPRPAPAATAPAKPLTVEEQYAELIRQGIIKPATRRMTGPPKPVLEGSFEDMMKGLDHDREDR
jgi:prevent-host-death family protein